MLAPDELETLNKLITEHNMLVHHIGRVESVVRTATRVSWYQRLYFWIRPLPWPSYSPKIIPHVYEDRIVPAPITRGDVMPDEIRTDHDMTAVWNMRKAQ